MITPERKVHLCSLLLPNKYVEKLPHNINPDFNMAYFNNNNNNLHQITEKELWYIALAEKMKEMLKELSIHSSNTCLPLRLSQRISVTA